MKKTATIIRVEITKEHICPQGRFKPGEILSLDARLGEVALLEGWARRYEEPEAPAVPAAPMEEVKTTEQPAPSLRRGKGDE